MPHTSAALPRFCGQALTEQQLILIRGIAVRYSNLSRTELAATACELLEWLRPNGKPKTVECRTLLEKLELQQQIVLPPQRKRRAKRIAVAIAPAEQQERTPIQVGLGQLQPIHVISKDREMPALSEMESPNAHIAARLEGEQLVADSPEGIVPSGKPAGTRYNPAPAQGDVLDAISQAARTGQEVSL